MRAATKKKYKKNIYLKNCTFYQGEGHICVNDAKEKNGKQMQKGKKVSKWLGAPSRPPSPTKQMVWRRYQTGLSEVISVFDKNVIKNDAFDLQKIMRKLL